MTNRFQVQLDVNEDEVDLLVSRLEFLTDTPEQQVMVHDLKSKIQLAWTEREDEIHKSPSEGHPTREMVRRWYGNG